MIKRSIGREQRQDVPQCLCWVLFWSPIDIRINFSPFTKDFRFRVHLMSTQDLFLKAWLYDWATCETKRNLIQAVFLCNWWMNQRDITGFIISSVTVWCKNACSLSDVWNFLLYYGCVFVRKEFWVEYWEYCSENNISKRRQKSFLHSPFWFLRKGMNLKNDKGLGP